MNWETELNPPTVNQISYIKEMCNTLHIDYLVVAPSTFDEASEMIEEMGDELRLESYE